MFSPVSHLLIFATALLLELPWLDSVLHVETPLHEITTISQQLSFSKQLPHSRGKRNGIDKTGMLISSGCGEKAKASVKTHRTATAIPQTAVCSVVCLRGLLCPPMLSSLLLCEGRVRACISPGGISPALIGVAFLSVITAHGSRAVRVLHVQHALRSLSPNCWCVCGGGNAVAIATT